MPNNVSIHRYQNKYVVLCKCPVCGVKHLVNMTAHPIIMPRVYCEDHAHLRHNDADAPDVRGISLRSHAAQKTRRAANQ
jgi:hypothetical protein